MTQPGLSARAAADWVRQKSPEHWHERAGTWTRDAVAADFASEFAGIPANSLARQEKLVRYRMADSAVDVLLGLYGCADRVRAWLPGLPDRFTHAAAADLIATSRPPVTVTTPDCQQTVCTTPDLTALPALEATPRDAGPYLTMGLIYARDTRTDEISLSVHRMLVLGPDRLVVWMVPGRRLAALHEAALRRTGHLAVSVNVGAPPAAMVASALNTFALPPGATKLGVAGALAGAPLGLAAAVSQPTEVLAGSELVIEGRLGGEVADETLCGCVDGSLPEFLGYDGAGRAVLPVLTVTAVTSRRDPFFQAVIGPGREQSVILGLAGALTVALTEVDTDGTRITDLHFSPAGGGMLLLFVAVRKESAKSDGQLKHIARRIFDRHRFVKLIVFTDDDVDVTSAEDVWWAVTTRANLSVDCSGFAGFRRLAMDPSQSEEWADHREADGGTGRTFVDATVPYRLRASVRRSFAPDRRGCHG